MKNRALLLLILIIPATGCVSWQQGVKIGLDTTKAATDVVGTQLLKDMDNKCQDAMNQCIEDDDLICNSLHKCQSKRDRVVSIVDKIYEGLKYAYIALPYMEKEKVEELYDKVKKEYKELMKLIKGEE